MDDFNRFKEGQDKQEAALKKITNQIQKTTENLSKQIFTYDKNAYFALQNKLIA